MWSRNYSQCRVCGRSDKPHMAKGLCNPCYQAQYRMMYPEIIKPPKRRWYEKNIQGTDRQKLARERRFFAHLREPTLQRDDFRCRRCGAIENLVVHHKDGQGRSTDEPNNVLDNLETLCRSCHMAVHRPELLAVRQANGFRHPKLGRWSRQWDSCQRCGTTAIKHRAFGYCWTCYEWRKRHQELGR